MNKDLRELLCSRLHSVERLLLFTPTPRQLAILAAKSPRLDLALRWAFGDFTAFVQAACVYENTVALEWALAHDEEVVDLVALCSITQNVKSMYKWALARNGNFQRGLQLTATICDSSEQFNRALEWMYEFIDEERIRTNDV